MGAAVASLAAALLGQEQDQWAQECVALCMSPPGTMSRCVCDRLAQEEQVTTVVHGMDAVPRMSISNFNELIDDLVELNPFTSAIRTLSGSETPARLGDPLTDMLPAGVILQIAENIEPSEEEDNARNEDNEDAELEERQLDGNTSDNHEHASKIPKGEETIENVQQGIDQASRKLLRSAPRLLRADPADYRNAMQMWPDMAAHVPLNYVRSLLHGFTAGLVNRSSKHSLQGRLECASLAEPLAACVEEFLDCASPCLAKPHAGHDDAARAIVAPVLTALRRIALNSCADATASKSALLPDCPDGGCKLAASYLHSAQLLEL